MKFKLEAKEKIVVVSGAFDPLHVGHIKLLKEARTYGDKLIVILNNDKWVKSQRSYIFMPEMERKEILEAIKYVDDVIISYHDDDAEDLTVCSELMVIKPDVFAKGGDSWHSKNIPERSTCKDLGIKIVFGVGYKHSRKQPKVKK